MTTGTKRQAVKLRVLAPPEKDLAKSLLVAPQSPAGTLAGTTEHFRISFDPSLGQAGQDLANALLQTCEQDYAKMKEYFGGVEPDDLPFNVELVPGGGGAYHSGTSVGVYDSPGTSDDLGRFLLLAEVDESFMEAQDVGWDDAGSNGEGLSRVLATERYPDSLDIFPSAASWLNNGRPDWVTQKENTDGNYISTGCSVLFLYFLRFQLGYSWSQIVQGGKGTLADTYKNLTGRKNALQRFEELVQRRFPQVPAADLTQDNPFPLHSDLLMYDPATGDKTVFLADAQGSRPRGLSKRYNGWRNSWSMIVPGNFGGNGYSDVLFYDPQAGVGEFYLSDGTGNITKLNTNEGWRNTWSIIVPGKFMDGSHTDLLFYDPTTGQGEFYRTDGSGFVHLAQTHGGWRTTWTMIIAGNFTNSKYMDLLFYDATTGEAELHTADGQGGMTPVTSYQGWRTTWKTIVPGRFTGGNRDDLLFYDATTGEGEFRSFDNNFQVPLASSYVGWRTTWSEIVSGNFTGGSYTSLLFYDPVNGQEELYSFSGVAVANWVKTNNWRRTWTLLVPGNFAGTARTEMLLYDAAAGAGEIWNTDGTGNFGVLKSFGGRRTTWSKIVPGNFTGGDFTDLLFYDADAGVGEFYATDGVGNLGFPLKAYSNWRNTWDAILSGNFTDSLYHSLLFYDRAAGTGEFYSTDGKGKISHLSSRTNWRTTWTIIVAGKFTHSEYTDLLFYEGSTGIAELYSPDGNGGMNQINPGIELNLGAGWQHIVVGNFTGRPLQDLFLFNTMSRLIGGGGILQTTDGKGNFNQKGTFSSPFQFWTQVSRGNFGGVVFFDGNGVVQFSKIDKDGNFLVQQTFGGVFPSTAILTPGAFS